MEKLIFLTFLSLYKLNFGSGVVYQKVDKDLTSDNAPYVKTVKTVYSVFETLCSYKCGIFSESTSNFFKFSQISQTCECMIASDDFTDTRRISQQLEASFFMIEREYTLRKACNSV